MERKDYCHVIFQHGLKEELIKDISVVELLKSIKKWTSSTFYRPAEECLST